PCGQFRIVTPQ
ncbi:hypothetical protein D043_2272B, partial [Vibrio parahaemolyticus EKP-021]